MADLNDPRIFDTGVSHGRAVLKGPPPMWSYSSLKDVETCQRRYALSRADYPDLWERHGYPRVPAPAAVKGDIVHRSLEIIIRALVKAGCTSTRSAEAVAVLRDLGGYTQVAEGVLDEQVARLDGNPRLTSDRRAQLARALRDWVPDAREQIQTYLHRMELRPGPSVSSTSTTSSGTSAKRYPARPGNHPERELVAEDLRLRGRLDLLIVDIDGVRILDFKTGAPDLAHHDQLRMYALLWSEDGEVNPDGLPVSSLIAAYPSHDESVSVPTAHELAALRTEVSDRIARADTSVDTPRPSPVVGEQCTLCDVRGLCDAYWGAVPATEQVADGGWYDLLGTVLREHGVKSWVIRESRGGREVMVRTPNPSFDFPVGHEVRIIGARRTVDPDEPEVLIASVTIGTEVLELTV